MNSDYRYSIENFRGLAIIFVVFSHFASFHGLGPVGRFAYFVVGDATAWFVFISGYLFYYIEQQRFNYGSYLLKKTQFVVLPYLLLSIPALAVGLYLSRPQLLGLSELGYIGWSLVVGGGTVVGPMWFIPMMVLFFVVAPAFNKLGRSTVLYPLVILGLVLAAFTSRPISGFNPFLSFVHFCGFYLLGIAFAVKAPLLDAIAKSRACTFIIVGGLVGFVVCYLYGYSEDGPLGFYDGIAEFNSLQFGKLCLLMSVFFIFERFLRSENRVLGYFANISFGLFFIHGFYKAVLARILNSLDVADPVIWFASEMFVVFVLSVLTVAVVKFVLKKKSRYVIGC